jgi:hypothetical protein
VEAGMKSLPMNVVKRALLIAVVAVIPLSNTGADELDYDYGEYDFLFDTHYEKAARFAEDLETHDYYGILIAFDMGYVVEQLSVLGRYPSPVDEQLVDELLFNGAAMFDIPEYRFESIAEVVRVDSFYLDDLAETVTFSVELTDDRLVQFSIFVDWLTLGYYGPFG